LMQQYNQLTPMIGVRTRRALAAVVLAIALLAVAAALFYEQRALKPVQACGCGEGVAIYVSPKGSDAWGGRLPEPSPDGRDGPLATLEKALEVARKLKAEVGGPVRIVLRGGVYRIERPVVLGPEDSGCSGCPLVIEAYPGEVPVISGGKPVSGFEEVVVNGVRAWAARVPAGWRFKQLFVNGERRYRARLPKEGFFYKVVEVPAYRGRRLEELGLFEGADSFVCRSGDVRQWRNLEDVEVVILHFWIEERISIESFDPSSNLVKLKQKTVFVVRDGFAPQGPRYYLENVFEALSEPGEWYLDREGKLYYVPKQGEDPAAAEVVAPAVAWRLLELRGDPQRGRFVENVVIRGLVFEHADWDYVLSPQAAVNVPGAIYMEGARNVVLENCTVRHVGGYAVEVGPGCRGVRIAGCELYDLGAGGVKVGTQHVPKAEWERVEFVDVEGNSIRECGRVFHSAVGVWVGQARFVRVLRNRIRDLYYTGVSVGWTWGYGESFASYNLVEGNVIHDVGKGLLSDMGGVYTLGVQPGTAVRCNVIYNVSAYQYGGWGIYLDEGSSYITVEGNLVYDTSHGGFHQHYGRFNVVRDNVFAFGREANVVLSRGEPGQLAFTFERNVVLSNGSPVFVGGYAQDFSSRNVISDRNVFWDLGGRLVICREQRSGRTYTLEEWRSLGYDALSLVENPSFVDPLARDFRLRENSPLLKLGFRRLCALEANPRG